MTGLDLEAFLHLLRADLGAWVSLGVIALILALMTWTSWGSRKALRKCLVLSVAVHLGLVFFGTSTLPGPLSADEPESGGTEAEGIRQIRVEPKAEVATGASADGVGRRAPADWERPPETLAMADPSFRRVPTEPPKPEPLARDESLAKAPELGADATPEVNPPEPPRPE